MDSSPFQRLSPELRNAIWELVLTQPEPISYEEVVVRKFHWSHLVCRFRLTGCHDLALVRTCKQIYVECGRLYFIHNRFFIDFGHIISPEELVQDFIDTIGPKNAAVLSDVTIRIGVYHSLLPDRDTISQLLRLERHAINYPHWHLEATLKLRGMIYRKCTLDLAALELSLEEEATKIELAPVAADQQQYAKQYATMLRSWSNSVAETKSKSGTVHG